MQKVFRQGIAVSQSKPIFSQDIPLSLPIDAETFAASVTIPVSVLQGIWKKAEGLIATISESISSAPWHCVDSKMVASRSGQRPHLVVPGKGGQFKCDEHCLNYKSLGICSHTVAVAHVNNQLNKFLSWFQKTKRRPNITSLSTHSMPAGRGKKGNQQPRKRAPKEPIVNRVDRLHNESFLGSSDSEFTPTDLDANIFVSYYCNNPYSNSFNMPFAYKPSVASHSMPVRFYLHYL